MNVSVCIATYNGEKYLLQQLTSILAQLGYDDELIISDDGSTDNTITIIKSINDPRIKLFLNGNEKGTLGNFEYALQQASGDFIFLSDQDDIWLPGKKERMVRMLQTFDIVVTDARVINESGETLLLSYFEQRRSGSGLIKNLLRNTYLGCCMAFRKTVLQRSLPFPRMAKYHDYWIGLIGEMYFKTHFEKQVLTHYRRHANNASSAAYTKSTLPLSRQLSNRFFALIALGKIWLTHKMANSHKK